jgi:SWI/SNF-related matrix-associated actin-dependent regulator of chromatin subfamily A3
MFRTASSTRLGAFPPPSSAALEPSSARSSVNSSSAANPIDLTLDDDDADEAGRAAATRGPHWAPSGPNHLAPGTNWASPAPLLSPLGSRQQQQQQQPWAGSDQKAMSEQPNQPLPSFRQLLHSSAAASPPSSSFAHLPPPMVSNAASTAAHHAMLPSPIGLPATPAHFGRTSSWSAHHASSPAPAPPPISHKPAVIDLTSSPSPPPTAHATPPVCTLPADLPLKTPVCIGQLSATALVLLVNCPQLRPSAEPQLQQQQQPGQGAEPEWTSARYEYQHDASKPANLRETINLKTPSHKTPDGTLVVGESFGFVEQKVATALGPMLGKGLIRIDVKARKLGNVSAIVNSFGDWVH